VPDKNPTSVCAGPLYAPGSSQDIPRLEISLWTVWTSPRGSGFLLRGTLRSQLGVLGSGVPSRGPDPGGPGGCPRGGGGEAWFTAPPYYSEGYPCSRVPTVPIHFLMTPLGKSVFQIY
jgi:hypothetical protein